MIVTESLNIKGDITKAASDMKMKPDVDQSQKIE